MTPSRVYLSTTIPYVNARPHLGHALELVQADVLARHYRRLGYQVRFQSGTDDNSLKNVLAAQAAGWPVQDLVTANGRAFAELRGPLGCRPTTSSTPAPTRGTGPVSSGCGGPAPPAAICTGGTTPACTAWAASSSTSPLSCPAGAARSTMRRPSRSRSGTGSSGCPGTAAAWRR